MRYHAKRMVFLEFDLSDLTNLTDLTDLANLSDQKPKAS